MNSAEKTFNLSLTESEMIALSECLENIVGESQTTGNNIFLMVEMAKQYAEKNKNSVGDVFNVVRTYTSLLEQVVGYRNYLDDIQVKAKEISNTF
jgi:hypothetical protein